MIRSIFHFLTLMLVIGCQHNPGVQSGNLSSLVNPFIGTGGHGHTYPGAVTPFGMVQLSPDNGTQGWDWVSGYHYSDTIISGFSHLHLSGTGIGDLCDISFMPKLQNEIETNTPTSFSHAEEEANPGYYKVIMDNGIKVELTTSDRVGYHRYTFPDKEFKSLSIDLNFAINWDKTEAVEFKQINAHTVGGYRRSVGWAKNQNTYFYAVFSDSITHIYSYKDSISGSLEPVRFVLRFASDSPVLEAKVGLSSANLDGAKAALTETSTFDVARVSAQIKWDETLAAIEFAGISRTIDTIFYTALYHTALAPSLYSDALGNYLGTDSIIHKAEDYDQYTVFSLWDTFRAAHPLFTIIHPAKVDDMIQSMLAFYRQYGLLPVWALQGTETNTMTGYHAIPVLAEAMQKGIGLEFQNEIYQAMLSSANQDIRGSNYYREYGYIPSDLDGWAVTKTLEYAYDDWCIAQTALLLDKKEDYQLFMKRSKYYQSLFDAKTGFMRAKDSAGKWVEPFDPFYSEHGFAGMYIEGTAWQHTWFVPHDVDGLAVLYGGKNKMKAHLDATFNASSEIRGQNTSNDISGLIGQYAHGNEPSHHIAYMYNILGYPHATQSMVRKIMKTLYHNNPDGLSGNEDCGQMSAWYVFSALGFYPVNPVSGQYVLGSPLLRKAKINFVDTQFEIEAINNSVDNIYVDSIYLNDQKLNRHYITHNEIMSGGTLTFFMREEN